MSKASQWISENIISQEGKTFLITGANGGLGYELSRVLAGKGARVIMSGRSAQRLEAAIKKIRSEVPGAQLEMLILDLADLDNVAQVATEFLENAESVDVLINNAGIMATPYALSPQGIEMQFVVNHLGHFLFTNKILPQINQQTGRIINMSSIAHRQAQGDFQPYISEVEYIAYNVYAETKLANILFTFGLNKIFEEQELGIRSYVAHPGVSATNLFPTPRWLPGAGALTKFVIENVIGQSPQMGVLGALLVAGAPAGQLDPTKIYGPKLDEGQSGYKGLPVASYINPKLVTIESIDRLWELSQKMLDM